MRSIWGLFYAILVASAVGCGGSTRAEIVSPAGEESPADLRPGAAAADGTPASEVVDGSEENSVGDLLESPTVGPAVSSDADELSTGTEASVEETPPVTEVAEPDESGATAVSTGEADEREPRELDVRLHSQSMLDGAVTLDVPVDFRPMSKAQREKRYAAGQRPSVVLANSAGDVNIVFNLTPNEMTFEQLSDFQRQMAALFRGQIDDGDWIGSSTTSIGGLDWFTIEMRTEAFGTKVWNLIAGTSCNGRLLLISFNATNDQEDGWKGPCRKMLESVRLAAEPLSQPEISAAK